MHLTHVVEVQEAKALEVATTTPKIIAPRSPRELAEAAAIKYGLNVEHFKAVIACESHWKTNVQSQYPDPTGPNGKEDSWGLVQIHLPSHREVTRAEAIDPAFAVEWMAKEWAVDRAYEWTCWRTLYAQQ